MVRLLSRSLQEVVAKVWCKELFLPSLMRSRQVFFQIAESNCVWGWAPTKQSETFDNSRYAVWRWRETLRLWTVRSRQYRRRFSWSNFNTRPNVSTPRSSKFNLISYSGSQILSISSADFWNISWVTSGYILWFFFQSACWCCNWWGNLYCQHDH